MDISFGVIIHFFCAVVFIGIVAFEVLILEGIRPFLPEKSMSLVEQGIHTRARKIMPFIILTLYGSGIFMAVIHFQNMDWQPFDSSFGILLTVKIILALSVFTHFVVAMKKSICGTMTSKVFKYTHLSIFIHQVFIILLAKSLYHFSW